MRDGKRTQFMIDTILKHVDRPRQDMWKALKRAVTKAARKVMDVDNCVVANFSIIVQRGATPDQFEHVDADESEQFVVAVERARRRSDAPHAAQGKAAAQKGSSSKQHRSAAVHRRAGPKSKVAAAATSSARPLAHPQHEKGVAASDAQHRSAPSLQYAAVQRQ